MRAHEGGASPWSLCRVVSKASDTLSEHERLRAKPAQRRTVVFIRHQMVPFRASVAAGGHFCVVKVEPPAGSYNEEIQRPFAPTHSPVRPSKSPARMCAPTGSRRSNRGASCGAFAITEWIPSVAFRAGCNVNDDFHGRATALLTSLLTLPSSGCFAPCRVAGIV
jgi:hypothetical protein